MPGENHRPAANNSQTLSHNVVLSTPTAPWTRFVLTILEVIGTNCTGSCKSNYHTIKNCSYHKEINIVEIFAYFQGE